jgi:pyridoxal phosphate-dependent aminotransferase EpsN
MTVDPEVTGTSRDDLIEALDAADIEARPTWKPMHLQPLYAGSEAHLTGVADWVFDAGLCLPSGSSLSVQEQDRVIECATGMIGTAQ